MAHDLILLPSATRAGERETTGRTGSPFPPLAAPGGRGPLITLDVNHAARYYFAVIKSFKSADTQALANGEAVSRFANIAAVARRKLRQLQIAGRLEDLRVPPGNRLEALKGDRAGQHSVRVNDQFRVCFRWTDTGAEDVEIVDYH